MPRLRYFLSPRTTPIISLSKSLPWRMPFRPSRPTVMPSASDSPKLYGELASWFHLLSAPADYAEEAAFARKLLIEGSATPPRTVLELGSGGGNNASHL